MSMVRILDPNHNLTIQKYESIGMMWNAQLQRGTSSVTSTAHKVYKMPDAGDRNYPWKTRTESTYDIALPDDTGDDKVLSLLNQRIPDLFEKHAPQLVFFQAGVDALKGDSFGR